MLICIEESHCLLTMMKRGILKKKSTCRDHEKEINGLRIPARKRECKVECSLGVPNLFFSAQCYAIGNIAHQRRLNPEGLWSYKS